MYLLAHGMKDPGNPRQGIPYVVWYNFNPSQPRDLRRMIVYIFKKGKEIYQKGLFKLLWKSMHRAHETLRDSQVDFLYDESGHPVVPMINSVIDVQ